jgi:hypothetical protein
MSNTKITEFLRQPSTVLGFSALIGTFTASLTGQLTWQSAVPAIAGALAAILLPDNGGAQVAIKEAAAAAVVAEQAALNQPVNTTLNISAKATATVAFLISASFGLSACAVEPVNEARGVMELPMAYLDFGQSWRC